jgi:hypothetical protein
MGGRSLGKEGSGLFRQERMNSECPRGDLGNVSIRGGKLMRVMMVAVSCSLRIHLVS